MEDDDCYEPDQNGHLELKYRGWTEYPSNLGSFGYCLLSLGTCHGLIRCSTHAFGNQTSH